MAVKGVQQQLFVKVADDYLQQINDSASRLRSTLAEADALKAKLTDAATRAENAANLSEAILAQLQTDPSSPVATTLQSHISNHNNPHHVTLTQIGGIDKGYVDLADESLGTAFVNHETDYHNPHQVTAAQIGTYTTHQIDLLLAAVSGHPVPTGATGTLDLSNKLNSINLVALGML